MSAPEEGSVFIRDSQQAQRLGGARSWTASDGGYTQAFKQQPVMGSIEAEKDLACPSQGTWILVTMCDGEARWMQNCGEQAG
jgi:hypothetical protein